MPRLVKLMMWVQPLIQDCAKSVTTRKLNVSSFPVVMPGHVKSALQELRTLASLVPTVENLCQQPIVFICEQTNKLCILL